jgi:hypothetical protein
LGNSFEGLRISYIISYLGYGSFIFYTLNIDIELAVLFAKRKDKKNNSA